MDKPNTKYLKDYRPPLYWVDTVNLRIELDTETLVTSTLAVRRNVAEAGPDDPLVLDGRDLELISIHLDGREMPPDAYTVTPQGLEIERVPDRFELSIVTRIYPSKNTALEGLYRSGRMYCTQCEAEGFRKITFFPDRPDVMAVYTCTVVADKADCPVLLANGNCIETGELDGNRHFATWEDPFPKPCYLFAMVAGDLVCVSDTFRTCSGRDVALRLYVEAENKDKCAHAVLSLKKAMTWDEDVFGREYDLDIYMIVAVGDFNMGAMENKGLNIFNAKYVLAKPETASDVDYQNIEGVIGHEYFHNWTGNRITLRNWFQLSLKEGLTVFRDQEFSADMTSRAVKRIADVRKLRAYQFPEDAGPMAHAVRPDAYIQMNNFYTQTVYEKGAEVIRMLHTLLGPEGFRKGMDLYFERFDGQAVTTDDFVDMMAAAGDRDLAQFRIWYTQAGTPEIKVARHFDADSRTYTLTLSQTCAPTPGQPEKQPLHIPVAIGLLDGTGKELPLQLAAEDAPGGTTRVLELCSREESFTFVGIGAAPTPSILRGFSAPVKLKTDLADEELAFLMAHDTDSFNRWEAGQRLVAKHLLAMMAAYPAPEALSLPPMIPEAFGRILEEEGTDKAFRALMLTLPSESELGQLMSDSGQPIDPQAVFAVRQWTVRHIGTTLLDKFKQGYARNGETGDYRPDAESVARRMLKNTALFYLGHSAGDEGAALVYEQFKAATSMTDEMAALSVLTDMDCPQRSSAIRDFYDKWRREPLVLEKWFAVQAASRLDGTLARVKDLMTHPDFSIRNPNKVRALIGAFCGGNPRHFHQPDGAGYAFLADQVLALNAINPQISARLASLFSAWKHYVPHCRELMKKELERIAGAPDLSTDLYEVINKILSKVP